MTHKPFSTLAQDTMTFVGEHLLKLFVVVALPSTISFVIAWGGIAVLIARFNALSSWDQFVNFFSVSNSTMYIAVVIFGVVLILNVFGLIATPLVTVDPYIPYRALLRRTAKYVGSYLLLMILVTLASAVIIAMSYLVITIIVTLIGMYKLSLIQVWEENLSLYLPNIALALMSVFFLYSPYILIEQGGRAWNALSTSASLVRHNFIHVIIRTVIIIACISVLTFLLQFIPVVGYGLAFFVSTIILTVYNYFVYQDIK